MQAIEEPFESATDSFIGGVFRKEWKADCTHLVMKSITVTIKVIRF